MVAYVVIDVGLKDQADQDAFAAYAADTNRLLAEAGVEVVAFDPTPKVLEGTWAPRMMVLQKYPDMAAVERVQHSAAYAPLKALRQRIADTTSSRCKGRRSRPHPWTAVTTAKWFCCRTGRTSAQTLLAAATIPAAWA